MALVWLMFQLQVNLPNFSPGFSKFIKRGGQPAACMNIGYGPYQNFRYSIRVQNRVKTNLHDEQVVG